eukprot:TRINITY_DN3073_c0_g2_i1.p1 TRINITY_DN3073_c0_g2~~TRINITY_DN3073_c0_g2_i1.p1  ORF type:complete len:371 (+),score=125.61 TRINITY_DN3073_c0_g2_i1:318-1430(+)
MDAPALRLLRQSPSVIKGTVKWTLENYSCISLFYSDGFVRSQQFSIGGHDWSLKIYPDGYGSNKESRVSVFLSHDCAEPEENELFVAFRMLVNGVAVENDMIVHRYPAQKPGQDWGFGGARALSDLGIVDDQMHIEVELEIFKEMLSLPTRRHESDAHADAPSLSTDLGALLSGEQPPPLSDVTFVFGKRERLAAHKAILAARSPVFRSMFTLGMKESTSSEVKIGDTSRELFEEMLRVIYTGRCRPEFLAEHTVDLLALADKYAVADLRRECEAVLFESVTRPTASSLLLVADTYHCDGLKRKLLDFIAENFFDVVQTEEFKEITLSSPALVGEVHAALAAKVSTLSQLKPAAEDAASTRPARRRKRPG